MDYLYGMMENFIQDITNDQREEIDKNTYKNGNEYKGNYKKDKKDGNGIYKWKNGDKIYWKMEI